MFAKSSSLAWSHIPIFAIKKALGFFSVSQFYAFRDRELQGFYSMLKIDSSMI